MPYDDAEADQPQFGGEPLEEGEDIPLVSPYRAGSDGDRAFWARQGMDPHHEESPEFSPGPPIKNALDGCGCAFCDNERDD